MHSSPHAVIKARETMLRVLKETRDPKSASAHPRLLVPVSSSVVHLASCTCSLIRGSSCSPSMLHDCARRARAELIARVCEHTDYTVQRARGTNHVATAWKDNIQRMSDPYMHKRTSVRPLQCNCGRKARTMHFN